jgi:GT2 family glycosyltransferase
MFKSNALRELDLFDPRFFLLYEDSDWSLRATNANYTLRFVGRARLRHKVSRSFGESWTPEYLYYFTRNGCLWIEKNFRFARWPQLFYHVILRSSYKKVKYLSQTSAEMKKMQKAMNRGILDYFLRRFGKRDYSW